MRCALCVVGCALCVVRCALCVVRCALWVVVAVVVVPPAAFLLGSVVAENRQTGGVFACLCNSRNN